MNKLVALNIADSIDVKGLKNSFQGKLITSTSTELFYKTAENKYVSIFNYGVVAFSNHTEQEVTSVLSSIDKYVSNKQEQLSETIQVEFKDKPGIDYENEILSVPMKYNHDQLFRIVLFDLSQSVALDYYSGIAEKLLEEVKSLSAQLEEKGKISLSKKAMMKFIGKSLNTKNKIADNLYVFDSPDITWENEKIDKIHKLLARTFDLTSRFKEIEYTFTMIDNSLEIFKDNYEHQHATFLEIVVIIMIFIEILQTATEQLGIHLSNLIK